MTVTVVTVLIKIKSETDMKRYLSIKMTHLRRFLGCLLINIFLLTLTNAVYDGKSCVKTPKINYLSDYTNLMKSMRMCNRVAKSKGVTDDEGRIYLSYQVPLNIDEDPNDLCKCIRSFVLQGDWWLGAKHFCYVECDTVTLMLIGTPDKEFIDAVPVYQHKDPIDILSEFYGIYSNTQVWKDNCSAKPGISQDGLKNIVWTCEYSGSNLPPPDVLCDYVYASINGTFDNSLLNKYVTHSCTVKGEKFYLNLVANDKSLKQLILTLIS